MKFTSKYDDRVTSIVSYCEIDDRNIASIRLGQQQDDEGKYDCLGEGKFEKYQYTALNMLKDSNDRWYGITHVQVFVNILACVQNKEHGNV